MRRQRFAAAVIAAIVIIALASFIPRSGSKADKPLILPSTSPHIAEEQHYDEVTDPTFTGYPEAQQYEPDAAEVDALARMLYGEARGVASEMKKAACVWCVLNRVDDPRFPDTVLEVLEAPYQFSGYKADYPLLPELQELAADVLTRYQAERDGDTGAGRVLPAEYVFFTGDGKNNHFTSEWNGTTVFQWTLTNPYED
ncbi:cell wall hydrolase [Anaerotruncus rubiinfantis]|uniref:cell wall hydrolase n=1 Tax=Anaerotruncus rubiinfantis TaxID=1720200 RepID=UPI001899E49A